MLLTTKLNLPLLDCLNTKTNQNNKYNNYKNKNKKKNSENSFFIAHIYLLLLFIVVYRLICAIVAVFFCSCSFCLYLYYYSCSFLCVRVNC